MKQILFLIASGSLFFAVCSGKMKGEVRGVEVLANAEIVDTAIQAVEVRDISLTMGETFYRAFYVDTIVVYQSQYLFDSTIKQLRYDSATNQITEDIAFHASTWRKRFLVFHKDSSYGYSYDKNGLYENVRQNVDSALRIIKGTNRFDSVIQTKPDSVVWLNRDEVKEVYKHKKIEGMPTGRTIMYYSKRLNYLKESFNKKVDSTKGMKFYKFEDVFDDFYNKEEQKLWRGFRLVTEMREIGPENIDHIMEYIKRYKSSTGAEH